MQSRRLQCILYFSSMQFSITMLDVRDKEEPKMFSFWHQLSKIVSDAPKALLVIRCFFAVPVPAILDAHSFQTMPWLRLCCVLFSHNFVALATPLLCPNPITSEDHTSKLHSP